MIEGGNLASIESQEEQDVVARLSITATWIGLSDILGEGTFSWADETAFNFRIGGQINRIMEAGIKTVSG